MKTSITVVCLLLPFMLMGQERTAPAGTNTAKAPAPPPGTLMISSQNDCSLAPLVCGNDSIYFTTNGPGPIAFPTGSIINPSTNPASGNSGCWLAGAQFTHFMIINIAGSGSLEWSLGPANTNDCFDWLLYPYTPSTCADLAANTLAPVRCNWNGSCNGNTGMATQIPTGGSASNFEPPLNVTAGEQYLLAFDNYSQFIGIRVLNFTGTATVGCITNLSEQEYNAGVSIYPNPASDKVWIDSKGVLNVYNTIGDIITTVNCTGDKTEVDMQAYPAGIYLFVITEGSRSVSRKVVIER